jgi:hypothetical protein
VQRASSSWRFVLARRAKSRGLSANTRTLGFFSDAPEELQPPVAAEQRAAGL